MRTVWSQHATQAGGRAGAVVLRCIFCLWTGREMGSRCPALMMSMLMLGNLRIGALMPKWFKRTSEVNKKQTWRTSLLDSNPREDVGTSLPHLVGEVRRWKVVFLVIREDGRPASHPERVFILLRFFHVYLTLGAFSFRVGCESECAPAHASHSHTKKCVILGYFWRRSFVHLANKFAVTVPHSAAGGMQIEPTHTHTHMYIDMYVYIYIHQYNIKCSTQKHHKTSTWSNISII